MKNLLYLFLIVFALSCEDNVKKPIDPFNPGAEQPIDTTNPPEETKKPPTDSDGDGVWDKNDNCPDVFGTRKNKGCPEKVKPVPKITYKEITETQNIPFSTSTTNTRINNETNKMDNGEFKIITR